MKRVSLILLLMVFLFLLTSLSQAQKARWLVTGYMDWTYSWQKGKAGTFDMFHFNPIFLFQLDDKLLVSAEVEYEHGGGEIVLE